jgi:hypothetical protein
MTIQDQVNHLTPVEESSSSDQSQVIDLQSAQPTAESPIAEPATENVTEEGAEDEGAQGEEDAEDAASEETATTESPSQDGAANVASSSSPTTSAESTTDPDQRCEIEKQPYDFDHCTVQIAIQLLPDEGDPKGRAVVVGVRSHLDAPILKFLRLNELGALPPLVNTLLDELKSELPAREQAARTALEKKRDEKAKRKVELAARTKSSQRGKKPKAATLAAAPAAASTATAPDNRPRPNVTVPTNTQQQMGLF